MMLEGHSFFAWHETCKRLVYMLKVGMFLSIAVCGYHLLSEAQLGGTRQLGEDKIQKSTQLHNMIIQNGVIQDQDQLP